MDALGSNVCFCLLLPLMLETCSLSQGHLCVSQSLCHLAVAVAFVLCDVIE